MEDKQLIERIKDDKKAGFRILIEQYQNMILNLAYSYLGNKEEAEDITQDLFIKVYNKINSFKGLSKLSTWMYRTSHQDYNYNTVCCFCEYKASGIDHCYF